MIRAQEYLETNVLTATPQQLHLMVVDGAIRASNRAAEALGAHDFENAHLALNEARGLVTELIGGLDTEKAPELVEKLKGLFVFVYRNLADADRNRDEAKVQSALKILRIHRDTWTMLIDRLSAGMEETQPPTTPSEPRSWTT